MNLPITRPLPHIHRASALDQCTVTQIAGTTTIRATVTSEGSCTTSKPVTTTAKTTTGKPPSSTQKTAIAARHRNVLLTSSQIANAVMTLESVSGLSRRELSL